MRAVATIGCYITLGQHGVGSVALPAVAGNNGLRCRRAVADGEVQRGQRVGIAEQGGPFATVIDTTGGEQRVVPHKIVAHVQGQCVVDSGRPQMHRLYIPGRVYCRCAEGDVLVGLSLDYCDGVYRHIRGQLQPCLVVNSTIDIVLPCPGEVVGGGGINIGLAIGVDHTVYSADGGLVVHHVCPR